MMYLHVLEEIIKKNLVKDNNIKEVITFYNNFLNSMRFHNYFPH